MRTLVFDLNEIEVRATLQDPRPHTKGMRFVIIAGTPVIREGELDVDAKPGSPIRRHVRAQ